jgi:hypothetical protein
MVLDGAFAASRDDDDVFDPGSYAFFDDVLNLWLVDHREHFFGLRFGGREESSTEACGGENGFADFAERRSGLRRRWIGRHFFWSRSNCFEFYSARLFRLAICAGSDSNFGSQGCQ